MFALYFAASLTALLLSQICVFAGLFGFLPFYFGSVLGLTLIALGYVLAAQAEKAELDSYQIRR